MDQHNKVLFLCTGNYYRSRFAEILFNHLANQAGLNWVADSRALGLGLGSFVNVGAISAHTLAGLGERNISLPREIRHPLQVCQDDLASSTRIIALKEAEHRPLMQTLFPAWVERVTYWHVHDLDQSGPQEALAEIEQLVRTLVDYLNIAG